MKYEDCYKWWSFPRALLKLRHEDHKTIILQRWGWGHHTQGIESRSLLLLPSASCLDLRGEVELEVFPFTLCLISPASPLTTPLTSSPSTTSFSRKPLFLGVGVWLPDTLEPLLERTLSLLTGVGVPWLSPLPRLLGVGVLWGPEELTGVDTVERTEMLDFWEFRDGERGELSPSAWNVNLNQVWEICSYDHLVMAATLNKTIRGSLVRRESDGGDGAGAD